MIVKLLKKENVLILLLTLAISLSFSMIVQTEAEAKTEQHGTYYQIFVRSFYDSTGDGVGDLAGITEKLDYLNDGDPDSGEDLGVEGIWLMPIMETVSYHGYDVIDYYSVHEQYGDLEDFNELTQEANQRGIDVIIDLPINHSSNDHPWFVDAVSDEDSEYRDYYIWADEQTDLLETREHDGQRVWHSSPTGFYYGFFWSGMPDLNYDNLEVRQEVIEIGEFWLEQGVDGFRIDGAKHIYPPDRYEKNFEWWEEFSTAMEEKREDVYIVGEVWDDADVVAPYFEYFTSNFNFELAENIITGVKNNQVDEIADSIEHIYQLYQDELADIDYIDAPFLTNHDQDRVMSELEGNTKQAKLAASIYLTMPGNPFIYYGEEIGMEGQKPDERIREPFQWSAELTEGETAWQMSAYKREGASVEEQRAVDNSLLSHYQNLIQLRNNNRLFYDGEIEVLAAADDILAYRRYTDLEEFRIYHNLAESTREIRLDANEVVFSSYGEINEEQSLTEFELEPYESIIVK